MPYCSDLTLDADYTDDGWEIVLRFDADSLEGAWTNVSDAFLSTIVGPIIADLLIRDRDVLKP